jgi:hypothetical protein
MSGSVQFGGRAKVPGGEAIASRSSGNLLFSRITSHKSLTIAESKKDCLLLVQGGSCGCAGDGASPSFYRLEFPAMAIDEHCLGRWKPAAIEKFPEQAAIAQTPVP